MHEENQISKPLNLTQKYNIFISQQFYNFFFKGNQIKFGIPPTTKSRSPLTATKKLRSLITD